MTAHGKKVMFAIGVLAIAWLTVNLMTIGYGFGVGSGLVTQAIMQMFALWPLALVGTMVWFGLEITNALHRIERAIEAQSHMERTDVA